MKIIPATSTSAARHPLMARLAGLVPTGGSGMPATNDGPIEVFLMIILGGFIGLLLGFIVAQITRFLSMFAGVSIGSPGWGAYGAIAGAIAFALFALIGGE
jgi:hypothetical protein